MHLWLWWENLRKGDNLEDRGVDGRIILKGSSRVWMGESDWIDLAQDRDRRRAVVNAVMKVLD